MKGGVKMNNLIKVLNKDGQLVVTSRQVARDFEKRHGDVLEKIDSLVDEMNSAENSVQYFIKDGYRDRSGKSNREYLLTRDGFSLLAMGFTGAKALQWKLEYIEAFNKMEQTIKNPFKNLSKELQAVFVLDKRTQEIESRVDSLENNMTVDFGQQRRLQNMAKSRAIKVLGGIGSPAYKDNSTRSKVFSAIWRDYKDYFMLGSYRDTARVDFDKAIEYLRDWQVQGKLLREIEECNGQLSLDEAI